MVRHNINKNLPFRSMQILDDYRSTPRDVKWLENIVANFRTKEDKSVVKAMIDDYRATTQADYQAWYVKPYDMELKQLNESVSALRNETLSWRSS